MLDNPTHRTAAAKSIVRDAMRGEEGDPMAELNDLDIKFFRNARINIQVPIVDPVVMRRCLLFLIEELPGLVDRMDRLPDRRSKSLLAVTTLRGWSQAFGRKGRK